MPTPISRKAVHEGDRQSRRSAFRFGEEFRALRLRATASQADVARAIGVSRSVVCRMEAGDPTVGDPIRARAAAAIGAEFRLAIYPGAVPAIIDAAQARIIEALLAARDPRWQATVEASIPGPGHRSCDLLLDDGQDTVIVESESRLGRLEEIVRELHGKRDALVTLSRSARITTLLVMPATRHHRAILTAHPETIRSAFPARQKEILAALTCPEGRWPGDGLLVVPVHPSAAFFRGGQTGSGDGRRGDGDR